MCTVQLFWKMQNLLRLKVHECSIHKAPLFSIYATERYTSYSKKDAYKSAHRSTVGHSQNLRDNSNVHQFQVNCEIVITVKSHTAKSRSATTTHSSVDELHKLLREKSQIPNGIFIKLQFRTRAKSSGVRSWGSGFFVAWGMIAGDSCCAACFCS